MTCPKMSTLISFLIWLGWTLYWMPIQVAADRDLFLDLEKHPNAVLQQSRLEQETLHLDASNDVYRQKTGERLRATSKEFLQTNLFSSSNINEENFSLYLEKNVSKTDLRTVLSVGELNTRNSTWYNVVPQYIYEDVFEEEQPDGVQPSSQGTLKKYRRAISMKLMYTYCPDKDSYNNGIASTIQLSRNVSFSNCEIRIGHYDLKGRKLSTDQVIYDPVFLPGLRGIDFYLHQEDDAAVDEDNAQSKTSNPISKSRKDHMLLLIVADICHRDEKIYTCKKSNDPFDDDIYANRGCRLNVQYYYEGHFFPVDCAGCLTGLDKMRKYAQYGERICSGVPQTHFFPEGWRDTHNGNLDGSAPPVPTPTGPNYDVYGRDDHYMQNDLLTRYEFFPALKADKEWALTWAIEGPRDDNRSGNHLHALEDFHDIYPAGASYLLSLYPDGRLEWVRRISLESSSLNLRDLHSQIFVRKKESSGQKPAHSRNLSETPLFVVNSAFPDSRKGKHHQSKDLKDKSGDKKMLRDKKQNHADSGSDEEEKIFSSTKDRNEEEVSQYSSSTATSSTNSSSIFAEMSDTILQKQSESPSPERAPSVASTRQLSSTPVSVRQLSSIPASTSASYVYYISTNDLIPFGRGIWYNGKSKTESLPQFGYVERGTCGMTKSCFVRSFYDDGSTYLGMDFEKKIGEGQRRKYYFDNEMFFIGCEGTCASGGFVEDSEFDVLFSPTLIQPRKTYLAANANEPTTWCASNSILVDQGSIKSVERHIWMNDQQLWFVSASGQIKPQAWISYLYSRWFAHTKVFELTNLSPENTFGNVKALPGSFEPRTFTEPYDPSLRVNQILISRKKQKDFSPLPDWAPAESFHSTNISIIYSAWKNRASIGTEDGLIELSDLIIDAAEGVIPPTENFLNNEHFYEQSDIDAVEFKKDHILIKYTQTASAGDCKDYNCGDYLKRQGIFYVVVHLQEKASTVQEGSGLIASKMAAEETISVEGKIPSEEVPPVEEETSSTPITTTNTAPPKPKKYELALDHFEFKDHFDFWRALKYQKTTKMKLLDECQIGFMNVHYGERPVADGILNQDIQRHASNRLKFTKIVMNC